MRDMLLTRWTDIGDRIVALAKEFPGDRYDFRPATGVRSFADQLRHVAFWNHYALGKIRGESPDGDTNELPAKQFPTKAKLVRALHESFESVASEMKENHQTANGAADTLVSSIEHNGEHYGQLAVYCRLNDIVPPASRA